MHLRHDEVDCESGGGINFIGPQEEWGNQKEELGKRMKTGGKTKME